MCLELCKRELTLPSLPRVEGPGRGGRGRTLVQEGQASSTDLPLSRLDGSLLRWRSKSLFCLLSFALFSIFQQSLAENSGQWGMSVH